MSNGSGRLPTARRPETGLPKPCFTAYQVGLLRRQGGKPPGKTREVSVTESAKRHQEAERHRQAERRPDHPLSTSTLLFTSTPLYQPLDGRYAVGVATCQPSKSRRLAVPKVPRHLAQGPHTGRFVAPSAFFGRPGCVPAGRGEAHCHPLTRGARWANVGMTEADRGQGQAPSLPLPLGGKGRRR
jgi:hypothetical protein